ncbi:hypothetical protein T4C_5581 [Trichinella pseudospiralis]|uniref:Uncharacterized protein n=1 Tax=Trichinella pseudospiralis TaxID=6337 RepID=A0A0V1K5D3_TRIPS|nr:hypothetical protein T4C_5581 [Trichinella pseudospiralis]
MQELLPNVTLVIFLFNKKEYEKRVGIVIRRNAKMKKKKKKSITRFSNNSGMDGYFFRSHSNGTLLIALAAPPVPYPGFYYALVGRPMSIWPRFSSPCPESTAASAELAHLHRWSVGQSVGAQQLLLHAAAAAAVVVVVAAAAAATTTTTTTATATIATLASFSLPVINFYHFVYIGIFFYVEKFLIEKRRRYYKLLQSTTPGSLSWSFDLAGVCAFGRVVFFLFLLIDHNLWLQYDGAALLSASSVLHRDPDDLLLSLERTSLLTRRRSLRLSSASLFCSAASNWAFLSSFFFSQRSSQQLLLRAIYSTAMLVYG